MVLDELNKVIANVSTNRAQVVLKKQQLEQQLLEVPKQIRTQIDNADEAIAEMDAAIAAIQVVMTDKAMLEMTQEQIVNNAGPLPSAAAGSAAAHEQSATEAASLGALGRDGLADQQGPAAGDTPSAADTQSRV